MKRIIAIATVAAMMTACGGGGSSKDDSNENDNTTSQAAGLWRGDSNLGQDVAGVVLPDGRLYFLYSDQSEKLETSGAAGIIHGKGSAAGDKFTAQVTDYQFFGNDVPGTVDAVFTEKQVLTGSATSAEGTVEFSTGYDISFEQQGTLAGLAGTYDDNEGGLVTIAANGTLTADSDGCPVTGQVTTIEGISVYNVTGTVSDSPDCGDLAGVTVKGVLFKDSAAGDLVNIFANNSAGDWVFFWGWPATE